jgi:tetratricopeptide (TPR) repeat protein
MRARVFTDAALAEHAGRFAWLAIDVEDSKNAAFLQKFPWEAVPTFMVVDPATENVVYKWLGTADVPQLVRRFDEAERAMTGASGDAAATALAEADRLYGADKKAEAVAAYRRAIDAGGESWPERARAAESMMLALALSAGGQPCAKAAIDEAPRLPRGPAFANVVSTGLSCALDADKNEDWRAPAIAAVEPLVREALSLPNLLGDDRSGLYATLVQARDEAGDEAGKKQLAGQWFSFLEQVTAGAKNAEERLAYDSHRVSAALILGDPARALPALEASARDLPDDYNPPARMAVILREMGRYDEALAASARALAKAYGPRKIGIYEARAAIYEKKGDPAAAKKTIADAIAHARTLPPSPRIEKTIDRLEKKM